MRKLSCLLCVLFYSICQLSAQGDSPKIDKEAFRDEFLKIINRTRLSGCNCGSIFMKPVEPVQWNDQLESAALTHAKDMSVRNYFSHTNLKGKTVKDRLISSDYKPEGYRSYAIGENIAKGQQSIATVMQAWLKSENHCKNLMNPLFKEVGIAQKDLYWVQDFGGREPFLYRNKRTANQP